MAPKRPLDGVDILSGRDRKKQKLVVARTIAIQPTQPEAGPSTTNSMARLPNVVDVERFADSRRFEISAMEEAMKTAGASSTQRAWQTLPRHLRRRAASHDVRRVPVRLRQKATAEMDVKKAAPKHKSKRGKSKQISKTDDFLSRQRDKTWLETHIWHAKRMKMATKWGYRLALHPSEKAYRPSHRASVHGSILHDASYQSIIELSGQLKVLKLVLDKCCDPMADSPTLNRLVTGARAVSTTLYRPTTYPFNMIGPVSILWQALPLTPPQTALDDRQSSKGNGKEKATSDSTSPDAHRVLWVRAHPTVHDQIFDALHESASLVLQAFKNGSATEDPVEIEIVDMRGKVNIFEMIGPKSSQVLKGVLQPVAAEDRPEFQAFWTYLKDLQTPASVPRGMVVGFTVNDPRLKFPPQNAKPSDKASQSHCLYPSVKLAQSEIWNEMARRLPKFKKKDLDDRRAKILVPGAKLQALRQDDRVPVLLIQHSLEGCSESLHGWTLIVPAGWSMAFFTSLVYTGTRVGGQRECQTQAFETGVPSFPRDHPFTEAYTHHVEETEKEAKGLWDRKPPAKRANFTKLLTRSPWKPDWEVVLGIEKGKPSDEMLSTQREEGETQEVQVEKPSIVPWLLTGDVLKIVSKIASIVNPETTLLSDVNAYRLTRGLSPLVGINADSFLRGALIRVRIGMANRGSPVDNAMLYEMSDEEIVTWENENNKTAAERSLDVEMDNVEQLQKVIIPPTSAIIGYVTTGHFSLMRGEAFALGCLPLGKYIELDRQRRRLHPSKSSSIFVQVRNPSEELCRVASITLVCSK